MTFDQSEQESLHLLRSLADLSEAHLAVKATAADVVALDCHGQACGGLSREGRKSSLEELGPDPAALSVSGRAGSSASRSIFDDRPS
jgi:hypothetical protein